MKNVEATMKKTGETTKKTEAKEEGVVSKHITVVYSDIRKRNSFYALVGLIIISLISIFVVAMSYGFTQPRLPRFVLDDLYVDSISNSSLMVKLSSTNPSPKTRIHYTKMSLHIWIKGDFETERVNLESTSQEPRERTTWRAVVDTNSNKKNVNPGGSFQIRKAVTDGEVIADLSIQWKCGIFSWSTFWRLRCPVLLNLEDLTSVVSKPMSSCSHHST